MSLFFMNNADRDFIYSVSLKININIFVKLSQSNIPE